LPCKAATGGRGLPAGTGGGFTSEVVTIVSYTPMSFWPLTDSDVLNYIGILGIFSIFEDMHEIKQKVV
jgi:hypothetical protein